MKLLYDEFMFGHKYVLEKYTKLEKDYPSMKKHRDKDGNEVIKIKSDFDGNDLELTLNDIKSKIQSTKIDMSLHVIPGALAMGYEKKFAHNLFEQMAKFAGYAFNKPHSGCYADECFQTAWLKTYYPAVFMTSLLSVRAEGADSKNKTLENLKECKRMGIKILPPNINKSLAEFYPEGNAIRYGLQSIAGIGSVVVDQIVSLRKDGDFKDFDNFIERTNFKGTKINRSVVRTLIQAGCFDDFEPNRYKLLNRYNFTIRGDKQWNGSLADLEKSSMKSNHSYRYDESKYTHKVGLEMERELIGMYVSGSPYGDLPFTSISDMELSTRRDKKFYEVGGRILNVKQIKTKAGKKMAFITLETQLDPLDVTIFPDTYEDVQQHLYKDNIVVVKGYKERDYRDPDNHTFILDKILVRSAKKLKREMNINDETPMIENENDMSDLPLFKPEPKPDLTDSLFGERKKKKKKKVS